MNQPPNDILPTLFGAGYGTYAVKPATFVISFLAHTLGVAALIASATAMAGLTGDDANLPIVQAVISLAHGLGIDVTAEGIETAEQLVWLREPREVRRPIHWRWRPAA